jgi:hypothetical protein
MNVSEDLVMKVCILPDNYSVIDPGFESFIFERQDVMKWNGRGRRENFVAYLEILS